MNQPQTPDNEVEVSSKQTMLTAQSDSAELYHALCDRLIDLIEKTNKVARLRELLNRAIEAIPDSLMDEDGGLYENTEHTKLKTELAAIAPAPEEPTVKESLTTEPAPEWRIRAEGERIETNDQVKGSGEWHTWDGNTTWGSYVGDFWEEGEVRTRRPLPKQEEMPLENEIFRLQEVGRLQYAEGQQDLIDCIRYLRDEIQKLRDPDHLHEWMRLQESINLEIAGELQYLRDEIQKLKEAR